MFHIGLNKFGFFVFYLLFCLLIGSSIAAPARADLGADLKFKLYIPTTLKTESQLNCFNKNRILVSNWRYGFENEYRKHEIRYNNEINEYQRLRRNIDVQLVTFFALDSTGKAALWSGTIAQLFKTLADSMQNILGILTGPQGGKVSHATNIIEKTVDGLRDGNSKDRIIKDVAVGAAATAVSNKVPEAAAINNIYTDIRNYRKLINLKGDWQEGVAQASKAHEKFDRDIKKLSAALKKIRNHRAESDKIFMTMLKGIEKYCLEQPERLKKQQKKQTAHSPSLQPITPNPQTRLAPKNCVSLFRYDATAYARGPKHKDNYKDSFWRVENNCNVPVKVKSCLKRWWFGKNPPAAQCKYRTVRPGEKVKYPWPQKYEPSFHIVESDKVFKHINITSPPSLAKQTPAPTRPASGSTGSAAGKSWSERLAGFCTNWTGFESPARCRKCLNNYYEYDSFGSPLYCAGWLKNSPEKLCALYRKARRISESERNLLRKCDKWGF